MNEMPLARIREVHPLSDYRLEILFDGEEGHFVVSLADRIARGGVFSALRNPGLFAEVSIGDRRRTIFWPKLRNSSGEPTVDIDAESLLALADRQRTAL